MFLRRASDYLRVPTDEPSYSLPPKEEVHSSRLPSSASEPLCLRLVLSAILTASLVATVLLSLCLAILVRQRSDNELQVSQLLSPIPKLPDTIVTFESFERFAEQPSATSDSAWNELMPPGNGFMVVDDPAKYNLKPGVPTKDGRETHAIAMYHQLHCLAVIRKSYWALLNGREATNTETRQEVSKNVTEVDPHAMSSHTSHCFDYLRQTIMCFGDMTLESARVERDGSRVQVDGWGIKHQCKSFEAAYNFAVQHKPFNGSYVKNIAGD